MFNKSQPAYEAFRSLAKERTSSVVAWIGSGLSASASVPTWRGLRDRLVSTLAAKISTLDSNAQQQLKPKMSAASTTDDFWKAFELLKDGLGATSYRETIKEALSPAVTAQIPKSYGSLWRLNPAGLINLNVDRLASRAFSEVFPGTAPTEFSGFQAGNCAHVLNSPHRFIVNLHGAIEDFSTWVFTASELSKLSRNPGYKTFIANCITSRSILFLGISADDLAVGGHLDKLAQLRISHGPHFWVTDRLDNATDRWAEKVGIRVIRYNKTAPDDHTELDQFFEDLLQFTPADSTPPPVRMEHAIPAEEEILEPQELAKQEAETIRRILNARAAAILASNTQEAYSNFEAFCEEYDEAIYRAWYVSLPPAKSELLGYSILERVARGAFGTVYRALSPEGDTVAVKVLNQEVRRNSEMLQSFRRGVKSMRILHQAQVNGMVSYREASEIPAFVVMDWIEGPNLRELLDARQLSSWPDILKIALRLTHIVRSAHLLPDRVLHRDLRPANIMIRNFYTEPDWDVVVLDFDLSWHLGSIEKTIVVGTETTGYLAPEQLQRIQGVSTRNAAVDSFGIGMTLYFSVAGRDPYPTEHQHVDWKLTVERACSRVPPSHWISLPQRFARAIISCTHHHQSERWDLAQLEGELSRLITASQVASILPADLVCEELAARCEIGETYRWNEDYLRAEINLRSGLAITIAAMVPQDEIEIRLGWSSAGLQHRKQLSKWLPDAARTTREILSSNGWNVPPPSIDTQSLHITASRRVAAISSDMQRTVDTLRRVANCLSFK